MSILQAVLKWAGTLPSWQSDAVSRLLIKTNLAGQDIDDLYALLKAAHGIADPANRTPKPLNASQIPVPVATNHTVSLRGIKNLQNVNALAANHRLPISPTGLTVIYGDNGMGKSGYSRVLKRACRSRDQDDPILPNANLLAAQTSTASAEFEVTVNGVDKDLLWTDGRAAPEELSALAIFDSRCARAYLDEEDDFSYVPYGLDVFERLASLCKDLKVRLDQEKAAHEVDRSSLDHLLGDTAVGRLVQGLSAKTSTAQIEALCELRQDEESRHADLLQSLRENDPKEKAQQLRLRARRLVAAANTIRQALQSISADQVTALRTLAENARTSREAANLAARQFHEEANLLPGTGGAAWKQLFEAALQFAVESGSASAIEDLRPESPCPLCQQPLGEASARLRRFSEFVHAQTSRVAAAHAAALDRAVQQFAAVGSLPTIEEISLREIEALEGALAADIVVFQAGVVARHKTVRLALESGDWSALPPLPSDPSIRVNALSQSFDSQAATLEKLVDANARELLQKEFNELDARIRLRTAKPAVVNAVAKLCHQAKLAKCVAAVKTNGISSKAAELTEQVVSKELESALNSEFKALGVANLRVSLHSRAEKGKSLHKLRLELPQKKAPGDILSEGEQRAVALGSFLAEMKLGGGSEGIIFDDPVSSLDHMRRELVARRLVAEAARRQVIVLTHDIYFLCVLQEEAKASNAPLTTQSLSRGPEGFGIANDELPFEGRNTKQRIGSLKQQQQNISKLHRLGHEPEFRKATLDAYKELRMTWERAVEETLFRQVILRFRKSIETNRLVEVCIEEEDLRQIDAGIRKCSNYVHDKAHAGGIAVPCPEELLEDIQKLEHWKQQMDVRSKDAAAGRKRAA